MAAKLTRNGAGAKRKSSARGSPSTRAVGKKKQRRSKDRRCDLRVCPSSDGPQRLPAFFFFAGFALFFFGAEDFLDFVAMRAYVHVNSENGTHFFQKRRVIFSVGTGINPAAATAKFAFAAPRNAPPEEKIA
jgi:hypothetical protein